MPLRDDLLNPIAGENPAGQNLRYAPVYDKIKEARREDDDAAQGDWKRERKTADFPLVIKLAGDALATKSKDLQLAAWLTEALLKTQGIAGLHQGLKLLQSLIGTFWDILHPELEDGDAELRAAPLDWIGGRLEESVKHAPITRNGYDWFQFKQSRAVGYEADTEGNENKAQTRAEAISDGKLTAEEFDTALNSTPKQYYVDLLAEIDAVIETIDSLSEVSEEKFTDSPPSYGKLKSAIEEVRAPVNQFLQQKRKLEPDEDATAEAPAEESAADSGSWGDSSGAAAAPARALIKAGSVAAEPADREDAISRVAVAARFLRKEDPYNPAPYLMLRGLRWGEVRVSGDSPDAALFEAPSTNIRQKIKKASMDGAWDEVLDTAETAMAMPCGRAWLDLQRYAVKACGELGYESVAKAVISELRALLADIPSLPKQTLMDDTPTANAETLEWIKDIVAVSQGEQAPAAMPSMDEEPQPGAEPVKDVFDLAMEALRSGNEEEGISLLTRELSREKSGRARFQRRIQLAQICLSAGHGEVAQPILEEVSREIESRRLEEWESAEVVAHPLAMLFRCIQRSDATAEEKRALYSRICRLDPLQALAVSK